MNTNKEFSECILEPDFDFSGAHLVAASAGTGKTYNIQNIYARMIQNGLRVSEIVVMTFTEAATAELRTRLRAVIADLYCRYEGKDCISTKETEAKQREDTAQRNERADRLKNCVPENERELAKARVGLALQEFDHAAISTIHGFCNRILKRYAFECNFSFCPEIEKNSSVFLRPRAMDRWNKEMIHIGDEQRSSYSFKDFWDFVQGLSGKADYRLDEKDGGANEATKNMLSWADEVVGAYEKERCYREKMTYDDMLRITREALRNPMHGAAFAEKLRNEYKAALIDEFQDTDPVQYDIFRLAFLTDLNMPVFFVGDPKQAIYAFRGGDIFTYLEAVKKIDEAKRYSLTVNYRSTPKLVDAVNMLFMDRDGQPGATFGSADIPYVEKNTPAEKIQEDGTKTYQKGMILDDGKEEPSPFKIVKITGNKDEADLILVREIVQLLNEYKGSETERITPKDIAVLVGSRSNADTIHRLLRKQGVNSVVREGRSVFASTLVKRTFSGDESASPSFLADELYQILKVMGNQANARQIRSILCTVFLGYCQEARDGISDSELAELVIRFREINQLWLKRGFGAAFAKFETMCVKEGSSLRERLIKLPNGERHLSDYDQIVELIFDAVKANGDTPQALLNWFAERLENADAEKKSEVYQRVLESDQDAVRIMTMHVSKGLQFPVVFLPDCNVGIPSQKLYSYHHFDGKAPNVGGEATQKKTEVVFTLDGTIQKVGEEATQEKTRLLYVAMTRAVKRTVLLYNNVNQNANEQAWLKTLFDNAGNNLNAKEGPFDQIEVPIEKVQENANDLPKYENKVERTTLKEYQLVPPKFSSQPCKGSYSSLAPTVEQVNVAGRYSSAPVFCIPGGADMGSCWHEIMEKIDFNATREEIEEEAQRCLQAYGYDPRMGITEAPGDTYASVTVDMIVKMLDMPLCSPDGNVFSLRDVKESSRLSEQEFNFVSCNAKAQTGELLDIFREEWSAEADKQVFLNVLQNWNRDIPHGFMNGFMDLVFQHEGFFYIVDWKSNNLNRFRNEFSRENVRQEMAEHGYFFQYLFYCMVLHFYLKQIWGQRYSWESHFGGIRYYFMRGIAVGQKDAVFADRPTEKLLERLGQAFGLKA